MPTVTGSRCLVSQSTTQQQPSGVEGAASIPRSRNEAVERSFSLAVSICPYILLLPTQHHYPRLVLIATCNLLTFLGLT